MRIYFAGGPLDGEFAEVEKLEKTFIKAIQFYPSIIAGPDNKELPTEEPPIYVQHNYRQSEQAENIYLFVDSHFLK